MFSFQYESSHPKCPSCKRYLNEESAVMIDNHPAYVSELGYITENSTDHTIILHNPDPEIICAICLADLTALVTKEEEN